MPLRQQSELCCLTLLAMAGLKEDMPWCEAASEWIRIHDIISFIADNYGIVYAENSRETFRKQAIHPFRTAALIEDNGKSTNSPNYRYRITPEFWMLFVLYLIVGKVQARKVRLLCGFLTSMIRCLKYMLPKRRCKRCLSKSMVRILRLVLENTISCRKLFWRNLRLGLHLMPNVCMWVIPSRRI